MPKLVSEVFVIGDSRFPTLRIPARGRALGLCSAVGVFLAACLWGSYCSGQKPDGTAAQNAKRESTRPEASKPAETEKNAAQIELLETKYRFEEQGGSRKEVHARVRINNELGARQFARLNFDFNRNLETVEIPLVRITHASGGVADILPSAITENLNPAVVDAPAYQDARFKSVRILGLQPGDLLEYRVITTTARSPLAPDFWLNHSFDRTGVVSEESMELDLPPLPALRVEINPATPAQQSPPLGKGASGPAERAIYRWVRIHPAASETNAATPRPNADIVVTTFASWNQLAERLSAVLTPGENEPSEVRAKARSISPDGEAGDQISSLYAFVSKKIRTVDLPLGSSGYGRRSPAEILASGYATAEDKFVLFAALGNSLGIPARAALLASSLRLSESDPPSPGEFDHVLTTVHTPAMDFWMDLGLEVAPLGLIATQFRDKAALMISPEPRNRWQNVVPVPLFASSQRVEVDASLAGDGTLSAKVHYLLRGDSELLLRIAFHQTPKEKWKDVAQLLALSDGFRGQVTQVTPSDPYATEAPFSVEYEISQPAFVDWSKKVVRIPAFLPQPGLPDPPSAAQASSKKPIHLGTPLEIELQATLQLPDGAAAQAPTATSVARDYATFSSNYSAQGNVLHASRSLRFLLPELPSSRAADFNAFLHAVQSDQTQTFAISRAKGPNASR